MSGLANFVAEKYKRKKCNNSNLIYVRIYDHI